MWHVYNLVAIGDKLRASTFRKVVTESNTGNLLYYQNYLYFPATAYCVKIYKS